MIVAAAGPAIQLAQSMTFRPENRLSVIGGNLRLFFCARAVADKLYDVVRVDTSCRDRGRERHRLPLPPNRTGGSPASGSPVGGLTFKRTSGPHHGRSAS